MNKILFFAISLSGSYSMHGQPQSDSIINCIFQPMPEAPYNLQKYLAESIIYPKDAENEGIDGRVVAKFIVTETGTFDSIRIMKPLYPSLDAEALRVIRAMPPWKPAMKDGKPIRVTWVMPITFRAE